MLEMIPFIALGPVLFMVGVYVLRHDVDVVESATAFSRGRRTRARRHQLFTIRLVAGSFVVGGFAVTLVVVIAAIAGIFAGLS